MVVCSCLAATEYTGFFSYCRPAFGLAVTLAAVIIYSAYIVVQIRNVRALQTEMVDRNRRDSLQLLRIQNDLNALALAMRDMLDSDEPYPLDGVVGAVPTHPHRPGGRAAARGASWRPGSRTPRAARSTWLSR